ncbi:hypothetical protein SAMN05661093_09921 [Kibdelosporangium aridum]|uniref:Uncharacterized protein n=1 Tax=Kibdelosporangium aridum TaxID=2030 RepID=A0A1W2FXJ9_KIBAR|nr:hypothetical protein SAMN05661093_09921 [Kibdelosporangium aridum]
MFAQRSSRGGFDQTCCRWSLTAGPRLRRHLSDSSGLTRYRAGRDDRATSRLRIHCAPVSSGKVAPAGTALPSTRVTSPGVSRVRTPRVSGHSAVVRGPTERPGRSSGHHAPERRALAIARPTNPRQESHRTALADDQNSAAARTRLAFTASRATLERLERDNAGTTAERTLNGLENERSAAARFRQGRRDTCGRDRRERRRTACCDRAQRCLPGPSRPCRCRGHSSRRGLPGGINWLDRPGRMLTLAFASHSSRGRRPRLRAAVSTAGFERCVLGSRDGRDQ